MWQIIVRYKVDPSFLSVLFSFAGGIKLGDTGAANFSMSHSPSGAYGKRRSWYH